MDFFFAAKIRGRVFKKRTIFGTFKAKCESMAIKLSKENRKQRFEKQIGLK